MWIKYGLVYAQVTCNVCGHGVRRRARGQPRAVGKKLFFGGVGGGDAVSGEAKDEVGSREELGYVGQQRDAELYREGNQGSSVIAVRRAIQRRRVGDRVNPPKDVKRSTPTQQPTIPWSSLLQ